MEFATISDTGSSLGIKLLIEADLRKSTVYMYVQTADSTTCLPSPSNTTE